MGPWKSRFELVIPRTSPTHLATTAREHGGSWRRVGLIVRVRDDRIRARYNERSRTSTAPLLKAHLVAVGADTRVTGDIQWTNVIAAPFATLFVASASAAKEPIEASRRTDYAKNRSSTSEGDTADRSS